MYTHLDSLFSGASYTPTIRAKRLQEINKLLKPYGIKITEERHVFHPVEGIDEITHQDITLLVWSKKRFFGWNLAAVIVPGEEFPRVKDGRLPEGFSIKKVVLDGADTPDYYKGYTLGYLLLEGEAIMAISGRRIHVTDLGRGVQYDVYQLHYAPVE